MSAKIIFIALMLFSSLTWAKPETVPYVDLSLYTGTWYQIARKPIFFEVGCVCSRQVLASQEDGQISVYNTCNDQTVNGPIRSIRGSAEVEDKISNAKLLVDFGMPFKGSYWIIGIDTQYRFAVVTDQNETTLFVLSKTPTLDEALFDEAVSMAAKQTDVSKLEKTLQEGCQYPQ